MITIYVVASDTNDQKIVDDRYEFISVPRIGERIILDNRGGFDGEDSGTPLRVIEVINYAVPKGDVTDPLQYVMLLCKAIG